MESSQKVRISEKSHLPIVAAVLSFIAAIFTIVGKWQVFRYYPLFYSIMTVIFPVFAFLLFTVFAAALSKKYLKLMLVPILLICLQHLLNDSGIYSLMLGSFHDYLDWMMHHNQFGAIFTVLECLLIIIAFVLCILTFCGTIKSKLPFIVICVINMFVDITLQVWYMIRGTLFIIPWYTLSVIFFLCAFILLASDLQNADMAIPENMILLPPYPGQNQPNMNQQLPYLNQAAMNRQMTHLGQPGMNQQMPYPGQPYMNQQLPYQGQPNMNQQMPYQGQPYMNQQMPTYQGQPGMNQQMPYQGQPNMNQEMPYQGQPNMNQQMPYQGQQNMNQQQPYQGQPYMNQQMPYQGQPNMNQQTPYQGQQNMNQQQPYQGQPYMNQQMSYPGQPGMNGQQPYQSQPGMNGQMPYQGQSVPVMEQPAAQQPEAQGQTILDQPVLSQDEIAAGTQPIPSREESSGEGTALDQ